MYQATLNPSSLATRDEAISNQPSRTQPIKLRGRNLTDADIDALRSIVEENWLAGRSQISRLVCESLGWYQNNGRLKDRSCRDILRSLEQLGLIRLPPSKSRPARAITHVRHYFPESHPLSPPNMASVVINSITSLSIVMVRWTKDEELWNSLVASYHYLGYTLIVGRHLKYIVYDKNTPVACLGWGDAAWHLKDRDTWIGWGGEARSRNIKFVVNNVRFLILPWMRVPNFASFILSRGVKAVTKGWEHIYGIRPILLETFVEKERFKGTCYKAANWIHVGSTKGYARRGYCYHNHQVPKNIFVYPLDPNTRELLRA